MNQEVEKGRKKVLFLITKATWGGAQRYVYDLATHLPAQAGLLNDEFAVSVAYGTSGRLKEMLEGKNIATHPLSALGRDVAIWSDIKSFVQLTQLFRKERPDIVHLNSSKAAALGALAGQLCGVRRIIFTVHGWPFKEDRNQIARMLIHFISWFTAFLSHVTIVVSKSDEEIGRKMWLVGKKVHYIPLGIESLHFLSRDEASTALSISATSPRIVTIGELTKNKGHRYAIDAIAELKKRGVHIDYFLMGDGELRAELQQQARDHGVDDRVHFLGFVENASQYLKAFDGFLLPSIKEGTPYVLLEAEIAGLPIVATNVIDTFWKESGIVTLVPPASASLLAEELERAIEKSNAETVQPFSTLDTVLQKTAGLY
ncbi:MAG TPA: glycosyltransferase [Candidatus Paceibacterota bacterium]